MLVLAPIRIRCDLCGWPSLRRFHILTFSWNASGHRRCIGRLRDAYEMPHPNVWSNLP